MRPTIGITTQSLHSIDDIPAALPASWVMNQRYFYAVTAAGGVPWMIPLLEDGPETLRAIYDRLDGVLVPGGVDIDPASFGEAVRPGCGRTDPPRDRVELQLTRWALEEDKPLLGLCRGAQIINVALGGTLYQDLATEYPGAMKHDYFPTRGFERGYLAHTVTVASGSRLAEVLGDGEVKVNSMHHQGVRRLAAGLTPTATAPDGLVEAVELPDHSFVVGVQWHPESLEQTDAHSRGLFQAFIAAATAWRTSKGRRAEA